MKKLVPLCLAAAIAACSTETTCPSDETASGGRCYALGSDALNCGAVGNACGAGQGCASGQCVACATLPAACASPAVVAACFNLDQVRPLSAGLGPAGTPILTDHGPIAFAQRGTQLYAANSLASSISAITLASSSATTGSAALLIPDPSGASADLEYLTAHGSALWVSNDTTHTVVVVDPAHGPVDEIVLGTPGETLRPQGLDFVGTKAYVALSAASAVEVVDASATPAKATKRIDLSGLAASDGTHSAAVAPSRVLAVNGRLYVSLNDYYAATPDGPDYTTIVAGAHGRLAVIDASADAVVGGAIDLGADCLNASGLALDGTTLWVGCGGLDANGAVVGGALVPVDLSGAAPSVGTAVKLAHAATDLTPCGGALYVGAMDSGTVVRMDLATRSTISAVVCPAGAGGYSFVPAVACAP